METIGIIAATNMSRITMIFPLITTGRQLIAICISIAATAISASVLCWNFCFGRGFGNLDIQGLVAGVQGLDRLIWQQTGQQGFSEYQISGLVFRNVCLLRRVSHLGFRASGTSRFFGVLISCYMQQEAAS